MRYTRTSFGWFIYNTWASMIFFLHFTVEKTRLPLPAKMLSYLHIQRVADKYAICEEGLGKNRLRAEISCVPWGNKGLGNLLDINFVRKNNDPREQYISFRLWQKMLLLTGKILSLFSSQLFCLPERRNSRHFFKLGALRATKRHAYLLRFSVLNTRTCVEFKGTLSWVYFHLRNLKIEV